MNLMIQPEVIQRSFYQDDSKLRYTARIESSRNASISICYSNIRQISPWITHGFRLYINCWDVNFKKLGFQRVSLLIVGLEQGLEH